ncbi:MAG: hypothetical protein WEA56_08805 [Balneolaceae bacterium]
MDKKKLGIYAGGFIASFLGMIVISYFMFPLLNTDEVQRIEEVMAASSDEPPSEQPVEVMEDSLSSEPLNPLAEMEKKYQSKIDSLYEVMAQMEADFEEKLTSQQAESRNENVEEIAKNLLNLDEEALAPIANRLDDSHLLQLYRSASSMQRQKLLGVIEPEKASKLLKEVLL